MRTDVLLAIVGTILLCLVALFCWDAFGPETASAAPAKQTEAKDTKKDTKKEEAEPTSTCTPSPTPAMQPRPDRKASPTPAKRCFTPSELREFCSKTPPTLKYVIVEETVTKNSKEEEPFAKWLVLDGGKTLVIPYRHRNVWHKAGTTEPMAESEEVTLPKHWEHWDRIADNQCDFAPEARGDRMTSTKSNGGHTLRVGRYYFDAP